MPKKIEIPYSPNRFDQWRLGQAGGYIVIKKSKPTFRFENQEQFQKYLELNEKRPVPTH